MRHIFSKRKRRRARKSSPNTRGKITRLTSKPAMRPMPNFLNACRWRPGKEWRFRSKRRWRANPARRSSSVRLSTIVSSWNWKKKASSTGSTSNDPRGANASSATGFKDRSFQYEDSAQLKISLRQALLKVTLIGCARMGDTSKKRFDPAVTILPYDTKFAFRIVEIGRGYFPLLAKCCPVICDLLYVHVTASQRLKFREGCCSIRGFSHDIRG